MGGKMRWSSTEKQKKAWNNGPGGSAFKVPRTYPPRKRQFMTREEFMAAMLRDQAKRREEDDE